MPETYESVSYNQPALRKIQVPSDILLIVLQLRLMSDITYLPPDQNLSPWFFIVYISVYYELYIEPYRMSNPFSCILSSTSSVSSKEW